MQISPLSQMQSAAIQRIRTVLGGFMYNVIFAPPNSPPEDFAFIRRFA
jgi:hypothetical protein